MDKGIIKINELNIEIEKLVEKVNEIEKIEFEKTHEKRKIENNINSLSLVRKKDNKDLQELKGFEKNIKKLLLKKILIVLFSTLTINAILLGIFINSSNTANIILIMITNLFTLPLTIGSGEIFTEYSSIKKKLKNNSILELENMINEKESEIEKNKEIKTNIELELEKLLTNKLTLIDSINLLNKEKQNIEKIRNEVIKKFLENNKKLDDLLNNEYEKEQQKQLIKKKDSK